ncbi:hypothetical protein M406DRAFT_331316 [Cryphonectria parasitica EP155]|uniref:Uncharacterized protein n=1 Tax=Cryphonectria parasitica (strain ATCC 38755 / EP155) TaxID=660469 RepID=A0A9P5CNC0_CRYP1|nr:uncharacterized protein M406DRAFT_331316 [Cryphonectria parasitica EP155]KAF3765003.1 hypothetical protein M406DRAFT_331316 [Cryphonectria parasitica EP155]
MAPSEPTRNLPSSQTYPSDDGSDVNRSSSFWSLPSVISSPAASDQSMTVNLSEPDCDSFEVLVTFPSESLGYKLLEEWEDWFVTTLYPKLLATERAWIELEKRKMEIEKENAVFNTARVEAALIHMIDTMKAQGLHFEITKSPHGDDDSKNEIKWELYMDGDCVWSGKAESVDEVLCSAFFSARRAVLKRSWYYRNSDLE